MASLELLYSAVSRAPPVYPRDSSHRGKPPQGGFNSLPVLCVDLPWSTPDVSFSNVSLTILFPGVGGRLFINKWLAVHAGFKNFLIVDKYEASPRIKAVGSEAKENAVGEFNPNIIFQIGASIFLPTEFKYTTFR